MKIRKIMRLLTYSALLSLSALTLGCTRTNTESKVLNAGVSADFPPFEFKQKGETVGYDIDVIKAVAQEMGYTASFQDMDFSALIPAVQSGRIDIAVGVTVTEERKKNVDFSEIYFRSAYALIVNKESSISSEEDLADKKVGVQLGTTLEKYAKEKTRVYPHLTVISLSKFPTLIQELKVNRIDGVVSEEVQAMEFVKSNPDMKKIFLGKSEEGYAVAFAKKSHFKAPINAALLRLKEKGELKKIYSKWVSE